MTTISELLTLTQRYTGIFIFDVLLKDATARYWSTQEIAFNSGGGSHTYSALIASHSTMNVIGGGLYGVDQVMEIQIGLNNADLALNSIIVPSNIQGGTIQPRFICADPATGAVTTDAIVFPVFVFDLPSQTWPICQVTAHNKWNMSRKVLPASTIGRHDRYPFPSTAAERLLAATDPTSEFWPSGYNPDHPYHQGNLTPSSGYYVATNPGANDLLYDGSREMLKTIGLEIRWGGLGDVAPSPIYPVPFGSKFVAGYSPIKGSGNPAKFGQRVPLAFGKVRVPGILLDTGGSPNGANWNGARLSHFLLADGVNFADTDANYGCQVLATGFEPKVFLTGIKQDKLYRVPNLPTDPGVQGAFTIHGGTLGSQRCANGALSKYRNASASDDYPVPDFVGRDIYSGLAYVDVGIPKELAQPDADNGPGCEVFFMGLIVETLDSGLNSVWAWSQNPVWIFVHCLKLIGWTWSDIDKQSAYDAAAYCDASIGSPAHARFRCNLYLGTAYKVADVLRGIRNNCRMYTTYGADGELEIKIEATTTEEGGTQFAIDSSNILRGDDGISLVRKFHKSIYENANSWTIRYQEEAEDGVEDTRTRRNITHINQIGEEIDGSGSWPVLGCPSGEQADRLLAWIDYKSTNLNEYYEVVCSQALIGAQVGQIGTITETRMNLSAQECRILSIAPNPDGSIVITLQKHADAAYSDTAGITAVKRARSDSTYSPRSVTIADAYELGNGKITVELNLPLTTYQQGFSSATIVGDATVTATGGSITGNQILFVEVCPQISGVDGLPSDWIQVVIPAGTNTNQFSFSLTLPAEADAYTVRIGTHPGRTYLHSTTAHSGTTPFTVTITSLAGLDDTSLSPDPWFDHVRLFYYYDAHPGSIHDAGRTLGPTDDEYTFEPEPPGAGDSTITVIACSANSRETDFYPMAAAPSSTFAYSGAAAGVDTVIPGALVGFTVASNAMGFGGRWNKPTTGNLSIDDYLIQYSAAADFSSPTTFSVGTSLSFQLALPNETLYFRGRAHNRSGVTSGGGDGDAECQVFHDNGGWAAAWTNFGAPTALTSSRIGSTRLDSRIETGLDSSGRLNLNGAVSPRNLSGAARSQHGVFFETFEGAIGDYAWADGATPSGVQSIEAGQGQAGGNVYKTTGYAWKIYTENIPYDPSKLYRLRVRLKESTGGTRGYIYLGVEGVAADGVTLVAKDGNNTHGNQYYVVTSADQPTLDTWVVYTGWMKGWSASPDGSPAPLATAPAPLHTNVRYIRPMFIVNYSSGTATVRIDEISIDICDEGSTDRAYRALDSNGDIINTRKISGRSEALSTTLQHISSTGTIDSLDNVGDGSTYVRTTTNQRDGGGRAYAGLDESGYVSKTVPLLMHDSDVRGGASRANTGLDENGKVALDIELGGGLGNITGTTVTGTIVVVLTTGMDDPCFTIGSTSLTEGDLIAIKTHCGL